MEAQNGRVAHVMTREVIYMYPNDTVADAYECMQEYNFRHIPIVDGECKLVGVVSDRDILRILSPNPQDPIPDIGLDEIMSDEPIACLKNSAISSVCATMVQNKIDCLPVIDRKTELLGLVTTSDLLELLSQHESPYATIMSPFLYNLRAYSKISDPL